MTIESKLIKDCDCFSERTKEKLEEIGIRRYTKLEKNEGSPLEFYEDGIIAHEDEIEKGNLYIYDIIKKDSFSKRGKEVQIKEKETWYFVKTDEATYNQRVYPEKGHSLFSMSFPW